MQQLVTIGPKYQIVIPKEVRKKIKGIKPGNKVDVKVDKNIISVKPVTINWTDLNYGKYKKYLKGADLEIKQMRDEWEERLKKLENPK